MALSHFGDKAHRPSEDEVRTALGPTYALWQEVEQLVTSAAPAAAREWGYTGASTGWGLRLKQGKRVLLYMTPGDAHFLASLALGEKAVAAAYQQRLPAPVLKLLDEAPKYAEGRGVRLAVRHPHDVCHVAHLIALKVGP